MPDSFAVINWDFSRGDALQRGLNLHFHRPAVVGVGHLETLQRGVAYGPKRAQVRVAKAPDKPHQVAGKPVSESRLRRQGASFGVAQDARADDHVRLVPQDRFDERSHLFRVIAEVGVEKHDNVRLVERSDPCEARRPVTPARLTHHARAVFFCD